MKTRLELKDLVAQFKGKTPDQIAAIVRERGIKARTGTTRKCALALLFNGANTGAHIIGRKYVIRQSGETIEKVVTPINLATFIRKFDIGHYPDLIAPAPRCLVAAPKRKEKKRPADRHKGPSHHRTMRHLAKMVSRFPEAAS